MANWKIVFEIFAVSKYDKSQIQVKTTFCLPLAWQCKKAMQNMKNTLVGIFNVDIFRTTK